MAFTNQSDRSTCVAIIGMACRFPGARCISEFWQNLHDGVESIATLSEAQLRQAGVSAAELANPAYVKSASMLEDVDQFDAGLFNLSTKDAALMDPQHRHFLECAWEALESAGWSPDEFAGRIGVYAGSGMNSYLFHNLLSNADLVADNGIFLLKQTGNDKDVLATRVSYQLNLTGPSIAVQTACSTSLVALHLACQSLLNQECDLALAGAVTIEIPHGRGYIFRDGEILSRDGHCRAFDADSSGTIFGSGLGIVVLRRLEDAIRDRDQIRAVILGTAVNNDGARKVGYFAPSVAGQAEVIQEALAMAQVEARSISYIEAHGTGTRVGDPIELRALIEAFGRETDDTAFCAIGSVKTNIGHLDAAAGMAGLIKTVLALQYGQIPASLNFSKPNPLLGLDGSPFFVNRSLRDWDTGGAPRRAGVTSLGIGGTNAHVILEEPPPPPLAAASRSSQLLTLSAKTPSALGRVTRRLADYLDRDRETLADFAYTLHRGRKALPYRTTLICETSEQAARGLRNFDAAQAHKADDSDAPVVFMFPGQGAQYAGMSQGLYSSEGEFKITVDFCADLLRPLLGRDLRDLIFSSGPNAAEGAGLLSQTRFAQPALFTIEYALAKLLGSWGIQPAAMIGHSVGEFAAACVAGVFSLETALHLVAERGRLMQSLPAGAMTAVNLPEDKVRSLLCHDELSLASVNAPEQCVVSGPEDKLRSFESLLSDSHAAYRRLQVEHAFHSGMVEPILERFVDFVRQYDFAKPLVPYISSATGDWATDEQATEPSYWAHQLRSTVRFADGVGKLLQLQRPIFVEIGPGHTLIGLVAQHGNRPPANRLIATTRPRHDTSSDLSILLEAVGKLWQTGKRIDWRAFHAFEQRRRVDLPSYPFEHQRYWVEPQKSAGPPKIAESRDSPRLDPTIGLYRPVWQRSEADGNWRNRCQPWLIFRDQIGQDRTGQDQIRQDQIRRDQLGVGTQLIDLLRRRGEQCIEVIPGDRFERLGPDRYRINPAQRSDFEDLIIGLGKDKSFPRTIVHLWSVVRASLLERPLDYLSDVENLSFYSLLYLAQALGASDPAADIEIGIISNGLQSVADEPIFRPERALLLGPAGVIPRELRNVRCRAIDLERWDSLNGGLEQALRDAAGVIVSELGESSADASIAFRKGRRWVQTFERAGGVNDAPINTAIRANGNYLITGGLGGIGLELADWLVNAFHARVVLIARSAFPARESWPEWLREHDLSDPIGRKIRRIQQLERNRREVTVVTADVTDAVAMRGIADDLYRRFGALDGLFHCAGARADQPLLQKDRASAQRVLAAKVQGTLVLEEAFAEHRPALFGLMSSVSSRLAPAGQIDYAAGSAFLNAFAQARHAKPERTVIAIEWPRWRDVGMAADREPLPHTDFAHPLLKQALAQNARETIYAADVSLERDWIVSEHLLTHGTGLLPGTAYIEIIRAAMASRGTGYNLVIRNLYFKAPLTIHEGSPRRVTFSLRHQAEGLRFSAQSHDEAGGSMEYASGEVSAVESRPPQPLKIAAIQSRCKLRDLDFPDGLNHKQARAFVFGRRWHSLRRLYLGRREAISFCELPPEFAPDCAGCRIHPALFDIATASALFLISGYENSDNFYIPIGYGKVTLYRDLPPRCYSHLRSPARFDTAAEVVSFDLTIADEQGNVIAEIESLSFRLVRDPTFLRSSQVLNGRPAAVTAASQKNHPVQGELSLAAQDSVSAAEGTALFGRLVNYRDSASVIVFPSDFLTAFHNSSPLQVKPDISSSGGDYAPRDEVEMTLANWWKSLLGVERLTIRDNFFALGGQSLAAIRFFAQVKRKYGVELGLSTLYSAPTVEALARFVRKEEPAPSSTLVPIHAQGDKPPLYLIHGLYGTLNFFNNLLSHLERDQPIFGVQGQMLAGSKAPVLTLEEMATLYLAEIRAKQPEGPYYFLGYSFGGLVAFEMAQQLVAAGQTVGLLGMLDTREVGVLRDCKRQEWTAQKYHRRLKMIAKMLRRAIAGPARLAYLTGAARDQFKYQLVPRCTRLVHLALVRAGRPLPWFFMNDYHLNEFAADQYRPRSYSGRITLFRAARGIASTDERFGPDLGWERWAGAGVEVHEIPGTHENLMSEPEVRTVAMELTACLQRLHDHARSVTVPVQGSTLPEPSFLVETR